MSETIIRELVGTHREETGLKGCPWCNGDVPLAVSCYQGEWASVAYCDDCDIRMVAEGGSKESAIENLRSKWNTRYERTCDIEDWFDDGDDVTFDLSCGHTCFLDRDDLPLIYCYKCGAKVVKE